MPRLRQQEPSAAALAQIAALEALFPNEQVLPAPPPAADPPLPPAGRAVSSIRELQDSTDFCEVPVPGSQMTVVVRRNGHLASRNLRIQNTDYSFSMRGAQRVLYLFSVLNLVEMGVRAVLQSLIDSGLAADIQIAVDAPNVEHRLVTGVHQLSPLTVEQLLLEIMEGLILLTQSSSQMATIGELTFSFTILGSLQGQGTPFCAPSLDGILAHQVYDPIRGRGVVMVNTAEENCFYTAFLSCLLLVIIKKGSSSREKIREQKRELQCFLQSDRIDAKTEEYFEALGEPLVPLKRRFKTGSVALLEHLCQKFNVQVSIFGFACKFRRLLRVPANFNAALPQLHLLHVTKGEEQTLDMGHFHGLSEADKVLRPLNMIICTACGSARSPRKGHTCFGGFEPPAKCFHCFRAKLSEDVALQLRPEEADKYCWVSTSERARKCTLCGKLSQADPLCPILHHEDCQNKLAKCKSCGKCISLRGLRLTKAQKAEDFSFLCCNVNDDKQYCGICHAIVSAEHFCVMKKAKRASFADQLGSIFITSVADGWQKTKAVAACLVYQKERANLDLHVSKLFVSLSCPLTSFLGKPFGQAIEQAVLSEDDKLTADLVMPAEPTKQPKLAPRRQTQYTSKAGTERSIISSIVTELLSNPLLSSATFVVEEGKLHLPLLAAELTRRGIHFTHLANGSSFKLIKILGAQVTLVDIDGYVGPKAKLSLRYGAKRRLFPRRVASPMSTALPPRDAFKENHREPAAVAAFLAEKDVFLFWPEAIHHAFLEAAELLRIACRLRRKLCAIENRLAARSPRIIIKPAAAGLLLGGKLCFPTAIE